MRTVLMPADRAPTPGVLLHFTDDHGSRQVLVLAVRPHAERIVEVDLDALPRTRALVD